MNTGGANSSNSQYSTDKVPQIPKVENIVVGNPQVNAPEVEDPNGALEDLTKYAQENINNQQSTQIIEQAMPQESPPTITPITQVPENNPSQVQPEPTIINTVPAQGASNQETILPNQNSMPVQKENSVLPETNAAVSLDNPPLSPENQISTQPTTELAKPDNKINPTENVPTSINSESINMEKNKPINQSATEPINPNDHKMNILAAIGDAESLTEDMAQIPRILGFTTE